MLIGPVDLNPFSTSKLYKLVSVIPMLFFMPLLELCISSFVGLLRSWGGEQHSLSLGLLAVVPRMVRLGLKTFA